MESKKVTRFFSGPLMKQNIKSNWALCLAILLIMLLLGNVVNYAMSLMQADKTNVDIAEYQEDFYTYLGALAAYDIMMDENLSYDDFVNRENDDTYDMVFEMLSTQMNVSLSVEDFEAVIAGLEKGGVPIDTYEKAFEYTFALKQTEGVFNKEELTIAECLTTTLEMMGVSSELVEKMSEMDTAAMMNQMYFTVMGLLPVFILIVILANGLIADQVDRGSMAYVLSTPTKRSAVAITQMLFMIVVPAILIGIVCVSRIGTTYLFYDEVNSKSIVMLYFGMYILTEAVSAICYLASCLFSQSKKAMGLGGGLATWFFMASLLGMFGSENMVNTGMGVEELSIFNKLTLIGLYDIQNISTVGTENVCYDFVWKLVVLGVIAIVCYVAGAVRFTKKDLPL